MYKEVFVLFALLAITLARPKDDQRETKIKAEDHGILNLSHREKLFEDSKHRVDATGTYRRNFVDKTDPTRTSGRVDYTYIPGKTSVGVQAENINRVGTKVTAEASRNLFRDRSSSLDVGANYGQTFGSRFIKSEPFFGGFVRATF